VTFTKSSPEWVRREVVARAGIGLAGGVVGTVVGNALWPWTRTTADRHLVDRGIFIVASAITVLALLRWWYRGTARADVAAAVIASSLTLWLNQIPFLILRGIVKPIASLLPLGPTVIEGTDSLESNILHFTIQLDKTVPVNVGVNFLITPPGADGHGADLSSPLAGTAVILAGTNQVVVDIAIVQDHFVEGNEPVSITLTDAINATIDPAADTATITIIDDDINPTALADTNWVQEDTNVSASGKPT